VPALDPIPVPDTALAGGFTGGGACGGGAPSPIETLGGPCWGDLDAGCVAVGDDVTVVLMVVVVVPDELPDCDDVLGDEVLGMGSGGGTVDGEGMPELFG
jgi:hypothetical protein